VSDKNHRDQLLDRALNRRNNIAVTPWLDVTADLQVVNPAIKRATNEIGHLARVDTAVIAGARTRVRFYAKSHSVFRAT
jgi:hypothetical protein